MMLHTDGRWLRDESGRLCVHQGINLVHKGGVGSSQPSDFVGLWTDDQLRELADMGFNAVRFGINWAAVEPEPGRYSEEYLEWVGTNLDAIAAHGMVAFLDAHQDLYSQLYSDGAPAWATLTSHEYDATALWSDAYLESPAVHEALDAFWSNAEGPGGVGLQDRFAAMWAMIAERFGAHPAVAGYDLLNEPTPGSQAVEFFETVIGAFSACSGREPGDVLAAFIDPESKLEALGLLEDPAVHRAIGDAVAPLSAQFEQQVVAPFMQRVRDAVRAVDSHGLILREHNYFANIGIPSGMPALDDQAWVYSPHGYDLTVDTPAIVLSSNQRASTIFERCRETAERLNVPAIVGEWGALSDA